jgi:hypothetical protein
LENKLDAIREFLKKSPLLGDAEILTDVPNHKIGSAGLHVSGDAVTRISRDVLGNKFRERQFSAVLFFRFTTETELIRARNILDLERLEEWIYDNAELLPPFGNFEQNLEQIRAENAVLYDVAANGESGLYQLQITKNYTIKF